MANPGGASGDVLWGCWPLPPLLPGFLGQLHGFSLCSEEFWPFVAAAFQVICRSGSQPARVLLELVLFLNLQLRSFTES